MMMLTSPSLWRSVSVLEDERLIPSYLTGFLAIVVIPAINPTTKAARSMRPTPPAMTYATMDVTDHAAGAVTSGWIVF